MKIPARGRSIPPLFGNDKTRKINYPIFVIILPARKIKFWYIAASRSKINPLFYEKAIVLGDIFDYYSCMSDGDGAELRS